ncbi:glycosyltransferase 87 family protein [Lewinella sp. JB7]|uniref:glycosyltransferase 87 family protein n=1 Tax=Lewinella sp. JB7 TaxID=2962887 RepID=UPI0020CA0A84|nr:glycosyltransferase 87 family protein [Lewinella sp. JB7]MCP9237498.1 glycosyltransferase 87 family protein [Lewinella sp. JB7]
MYLGFGVDRSDFVSLFTAFTVAFLGYLVVLLVRGGSSQLPYWIGLGIALRLVLIFAFPLLSDDVYRFIWDGRLVAAGENPFVHLPAYYLEGGNGVPGLSRQLFERLNSPEYHSIYPPLAQAVFTVAAWISPQSWYGAAVVMKVFLLLAELGSLALLWQLLPAFGLPRFRLLYYWLNPLIITEIVGNIHFEGMMICFLLLSLRLLTRSRYGGAAGAMACSIASKLLPLMFLPFLLRRLWKRSFWVFFLTLGLGIVVLFLPLLAGSEVVGGFGGSLDLYFRKFEFNASLYYLARAYGYYELGWNQIARFGPLLARVAAALIFMVALGDRTTDWRSLPGLWLAAFVIYLLCATTVHPWYLSLPIVLCCFTRWRFPLAWSYLIMLTYTSYVAQPYRENLWLVAIEYVLVLLFFLAERHKKQRPVRISHGP